jgi:hypothetical protein
MINFTDVPWTMRNNPLGLAQTGRIQKDWYSPIAVAHMKSVSVCRFTKVLITEHGMEFLEPIDIYNNYFAKEHVFRFQVIKPMTLPPVETPNQARPLATYRYYLGRSSNHHVEMLGTLSTRIINERGD